jgi:hypothetical protein
MGRKRGRRTTATTPGCRKPGYTEATASIGPAFPDPNGQGALILRNFDMGSPQVRSAFKTCDSLTNFKGPMRVQISNSGP